MPQHARDTHRVRALRAVGALLCLAVAGCGQTGPLYLPDERSEVIIREAPPQKTLPQRTPPTTTQNPL